LTVCLSCMRSIERRGAPETARRVRQRISAVFVYAIATGRADADPAAIVKGAMAKPKRSNLPAVTNLDGLRAVLQAAEAIPAHPGTRLALRFIALVACRNSEIRGMKRSEFEGLDGPEPVWCIPKERMKADREHLFPLAHQSVEVVKLATSLIGRGELIFPSVRHAHRPMSENALGYLLNRAGYHGKHVPHGFRAAFSSIMNERYPEYRSVIDLMLAHVNKDKTEAAYNRALHLPLSLRLAQEWADALLEGMPPATSLLSLAWR
jgi:integrase